jgi:hypothetical protein
MVYSLFIYPELYCELVDRIAFLIVIMICLISCYQTMRICCVNV